MTDIPPTSSRLPGLRAMSPADRRTAVARADLLVQPFVDTDRVHELRSIRRPGG